MDSLSSDGFFSNGVTMAVLKALGNMPVVRERFIILVMVGISMSEHDLSN
jgi:hypothetical protein